VVGDQLSELPIFSLFVDCQRSVAALTISLMCCLFITRYWNSVF